jgi:biopolymer transport protein ExbB
MNSTHVIQQGDPIIMAVLCLLWGMSLASWYVIFWKAWRLRKERRALATFQARYTQKPDWPRHENVSTMPEGSVGLLIQETARLESVLASSDAAQAREILSFHLVQVLDKIKVRLDQGLTILASVGSASPFIGLFGTVWGVYGALTRISAEGNAGLSVVAGPMGEALVATAIGLFAAIPAVLAYNGYVRLHRLLVQDLRHIAEQIALYLPVLPQRQAAGPVKLVREGN